MVVWLLLHHTHVSIQAVNHEGSFCLGCPSMHQDLLYGSYIPMLALNHSCPSSCTSYHLSRRSTLQSVCSTHFSTPSFPPDHLLTHVSVPFPLSPIIAGRPRDLPGTSQGHVPLSRSHPLEYYRISDPSPSFFLPRRSSSCPSWSRSPADPSTPACSRGPCWPARVSATH